MTNFLHETSICSGEQVCNFFFFKSNDKCGSYSLDKLNLNIWPSTMSLTLGIPKQMFRIPLSLVKENKCAKLFQTTLIGVELCSGQSQFKISDLELWPWPCKYRNKLFASTCLERMCGKLFLNPTISVEVTPQTFKCDLDLGRIKTNSLQTIVLV